MKRIILACFVIMSLFSTSMCTSYPTVPRVFGPGSLIPIGYLNEDFNSLASGFSSGLYKANFKELYINNSLFIDSSRGAVFGNMTVTGNLNIAGNLSVTGNTSIVVNGLTAGTISSSAVNINIATFNSLVSSTSNLVSVNVGNINATNALLYNTTITSGNIVMVSGSIENTPIGRVSMDTAVFMGDSTKFLQVTNGDKQYQTNNMMRSAFSSRFVIASTTNSTLTINIHTNPGGNMQTVPYVIEATAMTVSGSVTVYRKQILSGGLGYSGTWSWNGTTSNTTIASYDPNNTITMNIVSFNVDATGPYLVLVGKYTGNSTGMIIDISCLTDSPIYNWYYYPEYKSHMSLGY